MYDIIIVGSGPAGANLARLIGNEYKTLLIDKRDLENCNPKQRIRKCCGGLLAPDAQKMIAKLGLSGSCHTHRMHVIKFAKVCRVKMLLFDYRLAPEHPFPAAVEDCITAYNWLLREGYRNSDIVLMGESAGGTLTLSTLIALRDKSIKLPKAAVSISPVTDLTCQADSFRTNAKKDIAPLGSWTTWTGWYIGNNDPHDPWLSPLMVNLAGLPPVMIQVGTHEIHLDDSRNFGEKAKESGVDVTLRIWDGMIHAFPLLSPLFPEAKKAMNEIGDYVRHHLQIQNKTCVTH